MFRFLHAADIHLDSPLVGLDRYESAPVEAMRGATRRAFQNLVQVAVDEKVGFVLIAGDLYDGDWRDYRTGLFFADQMSVLREAGIKVFIVAGNHDAASQLTKNLHPPDNVYFFSTKKAETAVLEEYGPAIHGQGFASRAVTDDLAAAYPPADRNLFNIGLLHTSMDGRQGHAPYAPTSLTTLSQKEYQYWALGHVHRREVVSKSPWVVFPGNLQGRHAREAGPKSCSLITVDRDSIVHVEEKAVDVLRWAACRVDASGARSIDEILDRISRTISEEAEKCAGRTLAARVEVTGSTTCHKEIFEDPDKWTQEARALAASISVSEVWVERVRLATTDADDAATVTRTDALASLLREVDEASADPAELAVVKDALADLRGALPRELFEGEDAVDPHSDQTLGRLIREARELLFARLTRGAAR